MNKTRTGRTKKRINFAFEINSMKKKNEMRQNSTSSVSDDNTHNFDLIMMLLKWNRFTFAETEMKCYDICMCVGNNVA